MKWSGISKVFGRRRQSARTASTGATNTLTSASASAPSANPDSVTELDALWQNALYLYVSRLPKEDQANVVLPAGLHALNQQTLEALLGPIRNEYSEDRFSQCLLRINPIINHIRSFAIVIDVTTQAHPNPASLIWGCLRLLLEV